MAKKADINLIPDDLKTQRKSVETKKVADLSSIVLLSLIAFVSVSVSLYNLKLKREVESYEKSVLKEQSQIKDLASLEEDASRLKGKFGAVAIILSKANRYSLLMDIISESTPREVVISNFSTALENRVMLSGNAQSYGDLARFILTILDQNLGGKFFSSVDLTSVNLDELSGRAKFSLVLYLKSSVLNTSAKIEK